MNAKTMPVDESQDFTIPLRELDGPNLGTLETWKAGMSHPATISEIRKRAKPSALALWGKFLRFLDDLSQITFAQHAQAYELASAINASTNLMNSLF